LFSTMSVPPEQREYDKQSEYRVFDDYTLNHFLNVLQIAKEKGVRMIVVSSPFYKPNDSNRQLKELCDKYETPYIELYDLEYYNEHPELFKDMDHLNDKGAHEYTALFFERIKPYLKNMVII